MSGAVASGAGLSSMLCARCRMLAITSSATSRSAPPVLALASTCAPHWVCGITYNSTSFSPLPCQAWHGYGVTSAHRVEGEVGADGPTTAPPSGAAAAPPPAGANTVLHHVKTMKRSTGDALLTWTTFGSPRFWSSKRSRCAITSTCN
jgi:hypothetical protein